MVKVVFLPENKTIEMEAGTSILEAAVKNGIDIPSLCEMGICTTCMVYVEQGENLIIEFDQPPASENTSKSVLSCISGVKEGYENREIVINLERSGGY